MKRVLKWVLIVFVAWVALIVAAGAWISNKVPVSLPMRSMFTDSWDRGWVQATGTWTIENDKQAFPFQTSEIDCRRDEGVCRESRASIGGGDTLQVDSDAHKIVKWDAHTVVYVNESPTCAQYKYTLNRATKTVIGVRERLQSNDPICSNLTERLVLNLSDGLKLTIQAREDATPWWAEVAFAPLRLFRLLT
jgi:hypothetical protein